MHNSKHDEQEHKDGDVHVFSGGNDAPIQVGDNSGDQPVGKRGQIIQIDRDNSHLEDDTEAGFHLTSTLGFHVKDSVGLDDYLAVSFEALGMKEPVELPTDETTKWRIHFCDAPGHALLTVSSNDGHTILFDPPLPTPTAAGLTIPAHFTSVEWKIGTGAVHSFKTAGPVKIHYCPDGEC